MVGTASLEMACTTLSPDSTCVEGTCAEGIVDGNGGKGNILYPEPWLEGLGGWMNFSGGGGTGRPVDAIQDEDAILERRSSADFWEESTDGGVGGTGWMPCRRRSKSAIKDVSVILFSRNQC